MGRELDALGLGTNTSAALTLFEALCFRDASRRMRRPMEHELKTVRLTIDAPIRNGKICLASGTRIVGDFNVQELGEAYSDDDDPIGDRFPCRYETDFNKLPDGITIGGDLVLENSEDIETLPKKLVVEGDLYIGSTAIEKLPDDIVVKGTIHD